MTNLLLLLLIVCSLSVQTHGVPLSFFFQYGPSAGDTVLPHTNGASSPPVHLPQMFQLYGTNYSTAYVSLVAAAASCPAYLIVRLASNCFVHKFSSFVCTYSHPLLCAPVHAPAVGYTHTHTHTHGHRERNISAFFPFIRGMCFCFPPV